MNERSERSSSQTLAVTRATDLAPPDYRDPVIEAYKKDVDRTLLRENLKLSVEERLRKAEKIHASVAAWREAGKRLAGTGRKDGS
jgi:hypothetical protein